MTDCPLTRMAVGLAVFCMLATSTMADEPSLAPDADGRYTVALDGRPMARFVLPRLNGAGTPQVDVVRQKDGWQRVELTWNVEKPLKQDELAVELEFTDGTRGIYRIGPPLLGDTDGDGAVTLAEMTAFAGCITGPGGECGQGCEPLDFDLDADIDYADFRTLQILLGGQVRAN